MEEQWLADRAYLRELLQKYPEWTNQEYAINVGRSVSWVKVWKKRLIAAGFDDDTALQSRSRARLTPPPKIAEPVVEAILQIRDEPPNNLRRVPGPLTIIYFLHEDEELKQSGHHLPTSPATVWRILDDNQRIVRPKKIEHEPIERAEPMEEWQIDFKDVTTATSDPEQRRSHDIETLDVVDAGTSILVANPAHNQFNAETVIETLVEVFNEYGKPQKVRFDRDPRFVGAWTGRDFPSALVRFLYCIGIEPIVCPAHRPDKNPFVERLHRAYDHECLQIDRPANLAAVNEVNAVFKQHYNYERPHQGSSCGNRPPRVAFPELPELPKLPDVIDPDAWLRFATGRYYKRKVTTKGTVQLSNMSYYIGIDHAGKQVSMLIEPNSRLVQAIHGSEVLKSIPLKGLHQRRMSLDDYVTLICQEANTEFKINRVAIQQKLKRRRAHQ